MQKIYRDLGSNIVCGRAGTFSIAEEENTEKIAHLREFLFSEELEAAETTKEIFKEAHPLESVQEVAAIRRQITEFAKSGIDFLSKGLDISEVVNGAIAPGGAINTLLKELRYLGDVVSTEDFYEKAGLDVNPILAEAQEEQFQGFTGSIPMMVHMVGFRRFAGAPYAEYNAENTVTFLKKCSALGNEEAGERLARAYRYNRLGFEHESLDLGLNEFERLQGIKDLAEKGNYYALEALGFLARQGELDDGSCQQGRADRVKLFSVVSRYESKERPLVWIDQALQTNRVGAISLGASLEDRMQALTERAVNGNERASTILYRAYKTGMLRNERLNVSPSEREQAVAVLLRSNEALLCRALYEDGDLPELRKLAGQGNKEAQDHLTRLYPGATSHHEVEQFADSGCEVARLTLMRHLSPMISIEGPSDKTLLGWALDGSRKAADIYIAHSEQRFQPTLELLFALLFAVN